MQDLAISGGMQNMFLPQEEKDRRKHAYYGEFLTLPDFDDGWRETLYDKLHRYIDSQEELPGVVIDVQKQVQGEIRIIVSAKVFTDGVTQKLTELTTALQQEYYFSPIIQYVLYGDEKDSLLPLRLQKKQEGDLGYERIQFQEQYTKLIVLERECESIEYRLGFLQDPQDTLTKALVQQLESAKTQITGAIDDLRSQLPTLQAQLYFSLASRNSGSPIQHYLSPIESAGVLDITRGNPQKNISQILSWMRGLDTKIKSMDERNAALMEEVHGTMNQLMGALLERMPEELNTSYVKTGILSDIQVDDKNNLISAQIFGTHSEVKYDGDKVHGFEIGGVSDIKRIQVLNTNSAGVLEGAFLHTLRGTYCWFYRKSHKYYFFEIDENPEFDDIRDCYWDEKDNSVGRCMITKGGGVMMIQKQENGVYEKLSVNGEKELKSIDNTFCKHGEITLLSGGKGMFYTIDDKYHILNIDGDEEFLDIDFLSNREKASLPSFFKVQVKQGWKLVYYYNEEYEVLELEGARVFEEIEDVKDQRILLCGCVKVDKGYQLFRKWGRNCQIIEINGNVVFDKIHDFKVSESSGNVSACVEVGGKCFMYHGELLTPFKYTVDKITNISFNENREFSVSYIAINGNKYKMLRRDLPWSHTKRLKG